MLVMSAHGVRWEDWISNFVLPLINESNITNQPTDKKNT